ncbi:hypothetical protein [Hymenobacter armeniacus]|uniref:DUF5675 domain-containing protein n=1 Tax=Hymenobacter armeniacus TaxID=2771358 RepID=A0ABR8JNF9_9BACT|nr:hypothetical protein [Hymenobacter armeniacus]MBD2720807.1 hypothetical protein [Hymenobacter armeniacus]
MARSRIHTSNYATDSEGCLLVGTGKTTDMLKAQLDAGDECWITITK